MNKSVFQTTFRGDKYRVDEVETVKGNAFHGFFNGNLTVTAPSAFLAIVGLQRKHLGSLPAGELIDFAQGVERLRSPK